MGRLRDWYRRVDKKLGGHLPGGVTPKDVKSGGAVGVTISPETTVSTPSTGETITYSGGGGSSSPTITSNTGGTSSVAFTDSTGKTTNAKVSYDPIVSPKDTIKTNVRDASISNNTQSDYNNKNGRINVVPERDITLLSNNSVDYNNKIYTGMDVVPMSGGKTANQLQNEGYDYAKTQDPDIKKGSYEITIPTEKSIKIDREIKELDNIYFTGTEAGAEQFDASSKEVYNPDTNLFMKSSVIGGGATAISRPPTITEKDKMDALSKTGQFIFGVDKKSENILTAKTSDLTSAYKQSVISGEALGTLTPKIDKAKIEYEKSINLINSYNKYIDTQGEFTGTAEQYKSYKTTYANYLKNYKEYDSLVGKYNYSLGKAQKTINVGLFASEEKQIREYGKYFNVGSGPSFKKSIYAPVFALAETLGESAKQGFMSVSGLLKSKSKTSGNRVLELKDLKITPETNLKTPTFGGTAMYSLEKGYYQPTITTTIPEKVEVKPDIYSLGSDIFKGAAVVSSVAPQLALMHFAAPAYVGIQLGRLSSDVSRKGGFGEGIKTWYKEAPEEAIATGLITASFVGKGISNIRKTGRVFGYTKEEIKLIKSGLRKVDYIREPKVGSFGSKETKYLKKVGGDFNKFDTNTKLGKYNLRLDLKSSGLTPAEIEALQKFNLRGFEIEKISSIGGKVSGVSASKIKTGGFFGPKTRALSEFEGELGGKGFLGIRFVRTETKGLGQLFKEKVKAPVGKTVKGQDLKIEFGEGTAERVATFKYKVSPRFYKFNTFDINPQFTTGRESSISLLKSGKISGSGLGSEGYGLKFEQEYMGIGGYGSGSQKLTPFTFQDIKPSIKYTPWDYGEAVGSQTTGQGLVVQNKVINQVGIVPTTTIKSVSIPITISKPLPTVSNFGVPVSAYAGKGLYDTTTNMGPLVLTRPLQTRTLTMTRPELVMQKELELYSIPKTAIKIKTLYAFKEKTKTKLKPLLIKEPILETKMLVDTKMKVKTKFKPLQTRQKELEIRMKELLKEKTLMSQMTINPTITTTVKPIKITGLPPTSGFVGPSVPKKTKESFSVFVKKFGKDIKLGEYKTLAQAKGKLLGELKSTLRAGGYVSAGEKKVSFKSLGIANGEFRVSKKDKFRVIQKKTRRLKSSPETSEILSFRKSPSKKKTSKRVWGF